MRVGRGQSMQSVLGQSEELRCYHNVISRGDKLIFTGGHICLAVAFKGPNVILGLYKCNYSLTVKRELSTATR